MVSNCWNRWVNALSTAVLLLACACGAGAQYFMASHAKVELVSEENSLEPGHAAWVGVLFDLDKGWHIYWVNPGDSGEPPKILWQIPGGFKAGEIRWPAPVRLGTGTVIDYGYEGRVLLPVELRVPADYKPGATVALVADVRYLICQQVCIPAKAHVTLMLPIASAARSGAAARRELFNMTRNRWPKPLPATWKARAADNGKNFVLNIETGKQETKAAFFPLDEDQVDNAAPQPVTPSATGLRITLKKSDQLLKPIAKLRGVVTLGGDRAFEISVPVAVHR